MCKLANLENDANERLNHIESEINQHQSQSILEQNYSPYVFSIWRPLTVN